MNNFKPLLSSSTIIRQTTQVNLMHVTAFTHFSLLAHSLNQAKCEALYSNGLQKTSFRRVTDIT
jgi:hypothetical protein